MKSRLRGAAIVAAALTAGILNGCTAPSTSAQTTSPPPPSVPAPAGQPEAPVTIPARTSTTNGMVYTDLTGAPVGAWVTVYGVDSDDATWPVVSHAQGRTVVQVPPNAPDLVVGGYHLEVSVIRGRVVEVTPETLSDAVDALRPGDTVYLHEGTYDGHYDHLAWNSSTLVLDSAGTAAQPVAFVAYPGERALLDNSADPDQRPVLTLAGSDKAASWVTVAGLDLVARTTVVHGGGSTAQGVPAEQGASHVRVVECSLRITDKTNDSGTGMLTVQGDGWSILGNTFVDPVTRQVFATNQGIDIQGGADDVEIADNLLTGLHLGDSIQVGQPGTAMLYQDVSIHDNVIGGGSPDNQRGISVQNVDPGSTISVESNTIENVGQGAGAVTVASGQVLVRDNTMKNIDGPALLLDGQLGLARSVTWTDNTVEQTQGEIAGINGATSTEAHS